MRTFYQFHGGKLNGHTFVRSEVEEMACGYTPDMTYKRSAGGLCQRMELDKQPKVDGYLGPMWDGYRYILYNGMMVYEFEKVDRDMIAEKVAILRYETQAVYNELSN